MRVRHRRKHWLGRIISHKVEMFDEKVTHVLVEWEDTGDHVWYSVDNRDVVLMNDHPVDSVEFGTVYVSDTYDGNAEMQRRITVPKDWSIEVMDGSLEILAPGVAPDTDSPTNGRLFPSGMIGDIDGEVTVENIAKHAIVQMGVSAMHEAFEWVRIDGAQVADPHPSEEEGEMWNWMRDRFNEIYDEYLERWPNVRQ